MHDQWFKDIEINGLLEKQCKSSIIQSKSEEYHYKSLAKVTKKHDWKLQSKSAHRAFRCMKMLFIVKNIQASSL